VDLVEALTEGAPVFEHPTETNMANMAVVRVKRINITSLIYFLVNFMSSAAKNGMSEVHGLPWDVNDTLSMVS
jgi:hypothetical protein